MLNFIDYHDKYYKLLHLFNPENTLSSDPPSEHTTMKIHLSFGVPYYLSIVNQGVFLTGNVKKLAKLLKISEYSIGD